MAVADLDGDTVPDLVTANFQSDNDVSVLRGNGDGSFRAAVSFAAGDGPASVAVAGFDDDSVPDLVVTNGSSNTVNVLLGNGDGTFQAAVSFVAGNGPASVAAADLDGDSLVDLVTANGNSDDVAALFNLCGTATATPTPTPMFDPLSKAQQACVNEMNKNGEKVNKAQLKENERCLNDFQREKLVASMTFDSLHDR